MLNAQIRQILRVDSPKISTAVGNISTSALAMLAAFCISVGWEHHLFSNFFFDNLVAIAQPTDCDSDTCCLRTNSYIGKSNSRITTLSS